MDKLIDFIKYRYSLACEYPEHAETMRHQAFGALEMYHNLNPDEYGKCERLWCDEWLPKFIDIENQKED